MTDLLGAAREGVRSDRFIGRGRELANLVEHLDALWRSPAEAPPGVRSGGTVVMLVGEAGVGKTRLARRFADVAAGRGATVLWGTCIPKDAGPPHGPWNEILATLLRDARPRELAEDLGSGAPAVARAFPELRRVLPDVPPATPLDPADERLRFWEAVSRWLRRSAERAPVVVVLDDLDAADEDTARLLRHVIRTTTPSPVLIMSVYREPARRHDARGPLAGLLRHLRVERPYHRLRLGGFGAEDIGTLLGDRVRVRTGRAGVRQISQTTRGNPFFVEIARRLLVDAWAIADGPRHHDAGASGGTAGDGETGVHPDGETAADSAGQTGTGPLGLPRRREELLDRRIARRSTDAATLLRLLAALPDPAGRELLGPISELPPARILDALEEDVRAGLAAIEGTGAAPSWRVAHQVIRDAFEARWTVARRAHLHRRVAQAMERLVAGSEREFAAALGWHYHASAAIPGAERGLRYLLLAAEAARGAYAHVRAATLLRMALATVRRDDLAAHADILGRVAQAEADAMLPAARRSADAAATAMADARMPAADIVALLVDISRSLVRGGAPSTEWRPLADRAQTLLRGDRGRQWARLAMLHDAVVPLADGPAVFAGRWQEREPTAVSLLSGSAALEDDRAEALHPLDPRTRADTDALLVASQTWRRPSTVMRARLVAIGDLVERHGAFGAAAQLAISVVELARHHGALRTEATALLRLAQCEFVLGEVSAATNSLAAAERRLRALDVPCEVEVVRLSALLAGAFYHDRDWHDLERALARRLADPASIGDPYAQPLASWAVLAPLRFGRPDVARERLGPVVELLARTGPTVPGHAAALLVATAAAWESGAADHAAPLRTLAAELIESGAGPHPTGSAEHAVARMTALLGHGDEAQAQFDQERARCDALGLRPLAAIAIHDRALAMITTGAGEAARADALLAEAEARFRALGMPGWEARAADLRGDLGRGASHSGAARGAHVTFPDGLTAREVEVLRMIARGSRAAEIGERLFLEPTVVQRHVANLCTKTGLDDAADLRDYAVRHGLMGAGPG